MRITVELPDVVTALVATISIILLWELMKFLLMLLVKVLPKWQVGKRLLRTLGVIVLIRRPFEAAEKGIERLYAHRWVRRATYVVLLIALVLALLLFFHFRGT